MKRIAALAFVALFLGIVGASAQALDSSKNRVRGSASATGTAATTIIPAPAQTSYRIYVTGVQCHNTSASTSAFVTLNDVTNTGNPSTLVVPANGGDNQIYITPLIVSAGQPLTFTSSASVSTIMCNAQGYVGP